MSEMTQVEKIQTGMLAVIILLLLAQISGVFGNDASTLLREQAAQSINSPTTIQTPNASPTPIPTPNQPVAQANPNQPKSNQPVQPPTPPVPTGPATVMKFDQQSFDFGTVKEGEKVKHTFKFKNTGKEPLIISNAKGSCGCTVPQWTKKPVPVGKSGEIEVVFDSNGKAGKRNQQVTVTANTNPPTTTIRLVGEVTPKKGGKTPATPAATTNPLQVKPN